MTQKDQGMTQRDRPDNKKFMFRSFSRKKFYWQQNYTFVESLRPTLNDTYFTENSEVQYVKEKDLGFLTTVSTLGRHIGNCRTFLSGLIGWRQCFEYLMRSFRVIPFNRDRTYEPGRRVSYQNVSRVFIYGSFSTTRDQMRPITLKSTTRFIYMYKVVTVLFLADRCKCCDFWVFTLHWKATRFIFHTSR